MRRGSDEDLGRVEDSIAFRSARLDCPNRAKKLTNVALVRQSRVVARQYRG